MNENIFLSIYIYTFLQHFNFLYLIDSSSIQPDSLSKNKSYARMVLYNTIIILYTFYNIPGSTVIRSYIRWWWWWFFSLHLIVQKTQKKYLKMNLKKKSSEQVFMPLFITNYYDILVATWTSTQIYCISTWMLSVLIIYLPCTLYMYYIPSI